MRRPTPVPLLTLLAFALALPATTLANGASPVTTTRITTPAAGVVYPQVDADAPPSTLTVTGTADGSPGNVLELRCYQGTDSVPFPTVPLVVVVGADHTFSAAIDPGVISPRTCRLRAVPTVALAEHMNGIPTSLNDDGTWSQTVPLAQGANTVKAIATDASGLATQAQINVTYSLPPAAAPAVTCRVPYLGGRTLTQARLRLGAAHCAVGRVTSRWAGRQNAHRIVGQAVHGGTLLSAGTKVALVQGKSKRPPRRYRASARAHAKKRAASARGQAKRRAASSTGRSR